MSHWIRCGAAMLVVAAATACSRVPPSAQAQTDSLIELAAGQAAVAGFPSRLTVASIADSRCPSDVTCATAGDAVVVVTRHAGAEERTDTLRLRGAPHSVNGENGELLELVDVRPYPASTDTGRVSVAIFRLSRGRS